MNIHYSEIGIGNPTFLSTEIENELGEMRLHGFLCGPHLLSMYIRIQIFHVIFILDIPEGLIIKHKGYSKFKFLLVLQSR
jgi:hypothetical protein